MLIVKKISTLTAAVLLLASGSALASNSIEECYKTAQSAQAIRECLKQELQVTRKEYRDLVSKLKKEADEHDRVVGRNIAEPALDKANLAFDRFVSAQCNFDQSMQGEGTGAGSANLSCQINLLQWRMGTIENMLTNQ